MSESPPSGRRRATRSQSFRGLPLSGDRGRVKKTGDKMREHARQSRSRSRSRMALGGRSHQDSNQQPGKTPVNRARSISRTRSSNSRSRSTSRSRPRTSVTGTNIFELSLVDPLQAAAAAGEAKGDPTSRYFQSTNDSDSDSEESEENQSLGEIFQDEVEEDKPSTTTDPLHRSSSHSHMSTTSFLGQDSTGFFGTSWNPQEMYLNQLEDGSGQEDQYDISNSDLFRQRSTSVQPQTTASSFLNSFQTQLLGQTSTTTPAAASSSNLFTAPEAFAVDQSINLMDSTRGDFSSRPGSIRRQRLDDSSTNIKSQPWAFWKRSNNGQSNNNSPPTTRRRRTSAVQNQNSLKRFSAARSFNTRASIASACFPRHNAQTQGSKGHSHSSQAATKRRRTLLLCVILLVALGIVVLTIYSVVNSLEGQTSPTKQDSQHRKDAIVSVLLRLNITNTRALSNPTSGAHQALEWLVNEDPLELSVAESEHLLLPRFALSALYFATTNNDNNKKHNWKHNDKWLTRASVCKWFGVSCYQDGSSRTMVTSLNLTQNQLQGSLPLELKVLSHLRILDLSQNSLSGHILDDWTRHCIHLQSLRMYSNQFSGPLPVTLSAKLKEVVLYQNHLTGNLPPSITTLDQLQVLYLHDNLLTSSLPNSNVKWNSLKYLHLHNNNMQGTLPSSAIVNMTQLVELSLSENDFTGVIPASFQALRELTDLRLDHNRFRSALPTAFGRLSNLKSLTIEKSGMTGSIPQEWRGMSNLQVLTAFENDLVGKLSPQVFGGLTSLRQIWLHTNFLVGSLPSELGDLRHLEELLLQSNSFRGALPSQIGRLSMLTALEISQNHLTSSLPSTVCELRTQGNLERLTMDCKSSVLQCSCCSECT